MPHAIHTLSLDTILLFTQDKMKQLLDVLKLETHVLEKNNIEELESITQEKIQLTEQIEKSEQRRIAFIAEKALDPNEPQQWIKGEKLSTLWQKIKITSEQCQKQNMINGLIINGSRRRVQAQMNILNFASPNNELVYSATGTSVNPHSSKSLAHV